MAESPDAPTKQEVARALMLRGSVFVHLDPRRDGVIVPDRFAEQPQLVLQIGLDLPVPILDLRVDSTGVSGTLSFNRSPFLCFVPWEAVFGLVGDDGRGMVFPDAMPPEIAQEIEHAQRPDAKPPAPKKTPVRNVVPLGPAQPRPQTATTAAAKKTRSGATTPNSPVAPTPLRALSPAAAGASNAAQPTSGKPASPAKHKKPTGPKRELPPYLRLVK